MNLKHLTDEALLEDTKILARQEREISVQILHHFKEIERRKLYSELGFSSLYEYATKELGYSNGAASRRIQSARLIKEFPSIEIKLINGDLNFSNLALAGNLFKTEDIKEPEKKKEILAEIENKSSRECDKILMNFKSDPHVPNERIERTSDKTTTVKFNFSDETMELFDKLKAELANRRFNNDEFFKHVFKKALIKSNSVPRPAPLSPGVNTRYIPARVKKAVFERDKGKCTKCGTTKFLQYDHITPYSMGGEKTVENLRLLCANCNQRSGITRGIINKAQAII